MSAEQPRTSPSRRSDAGFTLLEVIVATAVTMTILGLTMQAYMGALNANEAIHLLADANQNLQVATTFMQQDLMKAGQNLPNTGLVLPGGTGSTAFAVPGPGSRTLAGVSTLYAVVPGDGSGDLISASGTGHSDAITVSYMDDGFPIMSLTAIDANVASATIRNDGVAGSVKINDGGKNKIVVGDLIVVNRKIIREVTSIDGSDTQKLYFSSTLSTQKTKLNQPGATSGGTGSLGAAPSITMQLEKLRMVTYYIDTTETAHPKLMRQLNARPAEPLALDVDNLQVSYDFYQTAGTPLLNLAAPTGSLTPTNIRKITLYLAARSDVKFRKSNSYLRSSTQTQVAIRSLGLSDVYK